MYSHGSSARAGVGKRGHGGRNYRPPPNRKDLDSSPPPLKQCSCLLQVDLPEYAVAQPSGRAHEAFGGRNGLQECERRLRTQFLVHLVVPGRKQKGPIAIVGKTYQEALPAAHFLLLQLQPQLQPLPLSQLRDQQERITNIAFLEGRIQRNVKNIQEAICVGRWQLPAYRTGSNNFAATAVEPYWLFRSDSFSVLACPLTTGIGANANAPGNNASATTTNNFNSTNATNASGNSNEAEEESVVTNVLETLKTCVDNLQFQTGSLDGLDVFVSHRSFPVPTAFSAGNPGQMEQLYREIIQTETTATHAS